jgi:hypothetical protein
MDEFIARHTGKVAGTLSGFDRLVFRGTLRPINFVEGMWHYLHANDVLLKDFKSHVEAVTKRIKIASTAEAERLGRPVRYLNSSTIDKNDLARQIAKEDSIEQGLVCVLNCVELCRTYEIHRNAATKHLELRLCSRKCLFLYHYWIDPVFGWMNARIQTWFPFPIQICVNGREWLGTRMRQDGLSFVAAGNCFPLVEDWHRAQQLLDEQLQTAWPDSLDPIARRLNPEHDEIFGKYPASYYWTTYQTEWAIDVVFGKKEDLSRLYPRLVHHGMTSFSCTDVIRYLGKPTRLDGQIPRSFSGSVVTDLKCREEGVRLKHYVNGNSVKLYDKAFTAVGNVLRFETTIQNADDFRVFRSKQGDPDGEKQWRKLRRGIADLHRRAEISRKVTGRYADAYSAVEDDTSLEELTRHLEQHTDWRGRRVRALRPFGDDTPLLKAINRGEFAISGFRNRDLQAIFFSTPATSPTECRRRSAAISRKLRLLRAHGLISKVPHTHRYQLTSRGRKAIVAILTALASTVRQLTPIAA